MSFVRFVLLGFVGGLVSLFVVESSSWLFQRRAVNITERLNRGGPQMASPKIVQFQPAPPEHRVAAYLGEDGKVFCMPVQYFVLTSDGDIRPYSVEDEFLDQDENFLGFGPDEAAALAEFATDPRVVKAQKK